MLLYGDEEKGAECNTPVTSEPASQIGQHPYICHMSNVQLTLLHEYSQSYALYCIVDRRTNNKIRPSSHTQIVWHCCCTKSQFRHNQWLQVVSYHPRPSSCFLSPRLLASLPIGRMTKSMLQTRRSRRQGRKKRRRLLACGRVKSMAVIRNSPVRLI